jgi:hypothetical protein
LALKEGAIKLGGKGRAGILDKCGRRRESSFSERHSFDSAQAAQGHVTETAEFRHGIILIETQKAHVLHMRQVVALLVYEKEANSWQ